MKKTTPSRPGSATGNPTPRKPSAHEVNAAVGDIKTSASNNLAPAIIALAKLAAEADEPAAEVTPKLADGLWYPT
jgi:hypothetical protein